VGILTGLIRPLNLASGIYQQEEVSTGILTVTMSGRRSATAVEDLGRRRRQQVWRQAGSCASAAGRLGVGNAAAVPAAVRWQHGGWTAATLRLEDGRRQHCGWRTDGGKAALAAGRWQHDP
jgi:hypothetical protein